MRRARPVEEVSGLLYEAALDHEFWPQALDRLADATGARIAALGSYDARAATFTELAPRQDPDYIRQYQEHWASRNPFLTMWWPDPPPGVITPEQFMPRDQYTRTEMFRGWVVPQGIEAAMAMSIRLDDGVSSVLRLWRPWRIGDFERHEVELFASLIPHIRRSLALQYRLATLEMHRRSSAELLDRLRDGAIIVDDKCGIMFANRAAGELLAEGDGLRCEPDGIAAATAAGTAALRRLLSGTTDRGTPPIAGGCCKLPRHGARAPLSLLAVPVRAEVAWIAPRRPSAVLFVTDPDRAARGHAETLCRRFGLTRAEAACLVEIVRGDGLQAAANRLGSSLATARTHLRHIFEKTGTSRQAELVGLATSGQSMLRS